MFLPSDAPSRSVTTRGARRPYALAGRSPAQTPRLPPAEPRSSSAVHPGTGGVAFTVDGQAHRPHATGRMTANHPPPAVAPVPHPRRRELGDELQARVGIAPAPPQNCRQCAAFLPHGRTTRHVRGLVVDDSWRQLRGRLTQASSEPSGRVDESAGAAGLAAIFFEGSQWHVLKT